MINSTMIDSLIHQIFVKALALFIMSFNNNKNNMIHCSIRSTYNRSCLIIMAQYYRVKINISSVLLRVSYDVLMIIIMQSNHIYKYMFGRL